ncbi:MAG TPA: hypothetical protein VFR64_12280 [Methylomirabilota bacterium]|nr:hypothetical protein [Methylomirabilota bacterium]
MKTLVISAISTLLGLGLVAGAEAQATGQPGSGTALERPAPPPGDRPSTAPGASTDRPDVNVDARTGSGNGARSEDGGAALPRQTSRETPGLFGLSPTTAALLAAALFIIVVLAVVSMTRGRSDTRVDLDRRL